MGFGYERLDVYQAAIEYVGWAYHLCERLKGHRSAKEQLRRASQAIPLNIAEGNGKAMVGIDSDSDSDSDPEKEKDRTSASSRRLKSGAAHVGRSAAEYCSKAQRIDAFDGMPVRRVQTIVIIVSSGLTMDVENNAIMVRLIGEHRPSWWSLWNPSYHSIYFRSGVATPKRAGRLYDAVAHFICTDERFAEFKIGRAEEELIIRTDWLGRFRLQPLGGFNLALKNTRGRADLASESAEQNLPAARDRIQR